MPIYMSLDGIPGDATDGEITGAIQLLSFSWGDQNSLAIASSGGGAAGRATFKNLTITKTVDRSSPLLFFAVASGQHIKSAVIYVHQQTSPSPAHAALPGPGV